MAVMIFAGNNVATCLLRWFDTTEKKHTCSTEKWESSLWMQDADKISVKDYLGSLRDIKDRAAIFSMAFILCIVLCKSY